MIPEGTSDVSVPEPHSITSFEVNMGEVIDVSMGIKAPTTLASDQRRHLRGKARILLQQLDSIPLREKEEFLDAVTDLVSKRLEPEDIKKILKRIESLETLGKVLASLERTLGTMNPEQQTSILKAGWSAALEKIEHLYLMLGEEMSMPGASTAFDYLLTCQAILLRAIMCMNGAMKWIEKHDSVGKAQQALLSYAFYGILRIEAFRRGKIDLSDLSDTYTYLLALTQSSDEVIVVRSPSWFLTFD
jgi:hypothetical protein